MHAYEVCWLRLLSVGHGMRAFKSLRPISSAFLPHLPSALDNPRIGSSKSRTLLLRRDASLPYIGKLLLWVLKCSVS